MKRVTRKHGLSRLLEYRAWQTMVQRCTNRGHAAYPGYGGRGIGVCDRWLDSPAAFIADMGRKPSKAHELDRIDNDRGYEPANCRWTTRKINSRNRRSNRLITCRGVRRPLVEWCEMLGLSTALVVKRLDAGWSVHRALETPARQKLANGEAVALKAAARARRDATRKLPPGVKAKRDKFVARIRVGGRERSLGTFDTPEAARAAYVTAKGKR